LDNSKCKLKWRTGQEVYDWWVGKSKSSTTEDEFDF
jgi:hypothetical protein